MLLVSSHLGHEFRERFMVGHFMLSDLLGYFLSAFVLLELRRQFRVLEFILLELMSQLRMLELVLLELMSQLRMLELVSKILLLELLFTERLAGDSAKNGAERTANRRANQWRCPPRYAFK